MYVWGELSTPSANQTAPGQRVGSSDILALIGDFDVCDVVCCMCVVCVTVPVCSVGGVGLMIS